MKIAIGLIAQEGEVEARAVEINEEMSEENALKEALESARSDHYGNGVGTVLQIPIVIDINQPIVKPIRLELRASDIILLQAKQ